MKFGEIFRFELRYQLRHVSMWLLFAVFLLFGFMIMRIGTPAEGAHLNAPGAIVFFTVFASVIWLVIGGVVAGDAATRDMQTGMGFVYIKGRNPQQKLFILLIISTLSEQ